MEGANMRRLVIQGLIVLGLITALTWAAAAIANTDVAKSPERRQAEIEAYRQQQALSREQQIQMGAILRVGTIAGGGLLLVIVAGWGILLAYHYHYDKETARQRLIPTTYGYPLPEWGAQWAGMASIATAQAGASTPHTLHFAPHYAGALPSGQDIAAATPQPVNPLLPGPVDLAAVLTWQPSLDRILLAIGPDGQPITVASAALCHVALAGATGGGKSNIMRLLLAQLLAAGAQVVLADPHFAPMDPESGEDWRPIAARLYRPVAASAPACGDLLEWIATDELPRRLDLRRQGARAGAPIFLAVDELPAIVADVKMAPDHLARVLREGRKVGLFVVGAAQDFLVKTIGGQGAVRDCYRTAYYVGGDAQTARVLLDVSGRVDDGALGRGVVMLRSRATPQAATVRVPLASNQALAQLLTINSQQSTVNSQQTTDNGYPLTVIGLQKTEAGRSDANWGEVAELDGAGSDEGAEIAQATAASSASSASSERVERIRQMLLDQVPVSRILADVWHVKPGENRAYIEASAELRQITAELLRGNH